MLQHCVGRGHAVKQMASNKWTLKHGASVEETAKDNVASGDTCPSDKQREPKSVRNRLDGLHAEEGFPYQVQVVGVR